MKFKVVYIAGAFRADTPWGVEANIRKAEAFALALELANHFVRTDKAGESGYDACPHCGGAGVKCL